MTQTTQKPRSDAAIQRDLTAANKARREARAAYKRGEITFDEYHSVAMQYHATHARLYKEFARNNEIAVAKYAKEA